MIYSKANCSYSLQFCLKKRGKEKDEGGSWGLRIANISVVFYKMYIIAKVLQKEPNPCVDSLTQGFYKRKEAAGKCGHTAVASIYTPTKLLIMDGLDRLNVHFAYWLSFD